MRKFPFKEFSSDKTFFELCLRILSSGCQKPVEQSNDRIQERLNNIKWEILETITLLRSDAFPLLSSSFKLSAISSKKILRKKGNGCRKIRIYSEVKRFSKIEKPQWLRHVGNQRKHLFKDKSSMCVKSR